MIFCIIKESKNLSDYYGRLAYRISTVDVVPETSLKQGKTNSYQFYSAVLYEQSMTVQFCSYPQSDNIVYNAIIIYLRKTNHFAYCIYPVNLNPLYIYMFAINFEYQ